MANPQKRHLTIDEYVDQLVAAAPPLTDEQIERAARIVAGLPPPDQNNDGGDDRS